MSGLIEAKDIPEAASYLRAHKLLPISIEEQKDNPFGALTAFNDKFSRADLSFFTRQLASMLTSGLTLTQALNVLKNQVKKKAVTDVTEGIISDIEEGRSFAQALVAHPRIFSGTYLSLVKAGEASGLLDNVMTRLAENLEKDDKLRSQVRGALLYPSIVLLMMVVVIFVMMLFVVPQLSTLYDSLAIELPFSTRILIAMSSFTVAFWPIIIFGSIGAFFLFRRWYRTPAGRRNVDHMLLTIPLFGKLIRLRILTEFSRTLGILVGSGDPVVSSLTQAREVTGNVLYEDSISTIAKQVEKGVDIGDAFAASPLFPPILVQMIRVGQQTGKLDENLTRAADYFEREVTQTIKTLTTAIEPIIMAILGLGVAFLLIAVITPIYKITNSF